MDNNQKSAFMPSLVYGLIMGVILVVFSLVLYITDLNENAWITSISYIITAAILFYAITSFRDRHNGGFITYGKGVVVGLYTGIAASVLLGIFTYIYVTYIDPGVMAEAMTKAEESMLQSNPNMSDEDLEKGLSMVKIFTSPIMMLFTTIFWYTIVSVVFSLLISIFAKREDTNIA